MKRVILTLILTLGIHGVRHTISHSYLNLSDHHRHKLDRQNTVTDWNNNGFGA